ncbi:MAG: ANTAR domain-containing response regulator [Methylohalobius sp. ZOD2]|nr:response regulator [Methylothermaceae bacterium]
MQKTKILVVDDDRLILATLVQGLRAHGYEVAEAVGGRQALETARAFVPDLALLDIRLPDIEGPEVAERLARQMDIPALFLSAYDDTAAVEKAMQAGGLGYLVKPLAVNQLLPGLEIALARAREIKRMKEKQSKLEEVLSKNRVINVAVGVLMERQRLPRQEAYEALRRLARTERRKVIELATQMIDLEDGLNRLVSRTEAERKAG